MHGVRGLAIGLLTVGFFLARAEAASTRLAVLIVVDADPDLSAHLSEIAISTLAERREYRLIGWRELREQWLSIIGTEGVAKCLERPECLARVGGAAQADSALIGEVRRTQDQFLVRLVLVNTSTSTLEAESLERADNDIGRLIAVVQKGVRGIATPKPNLRELPPALAPIGVNSEVKSAATPHIARPAVEPRPDRWPTMVAYGSAGGAVISFSAAVAFGSLATAMPTGTTRAEVQADVERRDDYASVANGLYMLGGALVALAAVALAWHVRHRW